MSGKKSQPVESEATTTTWFSGVGTGLYGIGTSFLSMFGTTAQPEPVKKQKTPKQLEEEERRKLNLIAKQLQRQKTKKPQVSKVPTEKLDDKGSEQTESLSVETPEIHPVPQGKTKPKLAWKAPPTVSAWDVQGYIVQGSVLSDWIDNPGKIAVKIDPPLTAYQILSLGESKFKLNPADTDAYELVDAECTIKVVPNLIWRPGGIEPHGDNNSVTLKADNESGYCLDERVLNAIVVPKDPSVSAKYSLSDEKLIVGMYIGDPAAKRPVQLTAEIPMHGIAVTCNVRVTFTKEQEEAWEQMRQIVATEEEKAKKEPEVDRRAEALKSKGKDFVEGREKDYDKEIEDPKKYKLSADHFPFGAANTLPHVHVYKSGAHLKIAPTGKRFDLIQAGQRRPAADEALAWAEEYDRKSLYNDTRPKPLIPLIKGLLKGY